MLQFGAESLASNKESVQEQARIIWTDAFGWCSDRFIRDLWNLYRTLDNPKMAGQR
jgi:hypothetical protein